MKTAEEQAATLWDADVSGPDECIPLIQQIQLDAVKQGMRRAAVIVENNQPVFDLPTRLYTRQALGQAILAAAEQLTEKDL